MTITDLAKPYIEMKRRLGYKFRAGDEILIPFAAFADDHQDEFVYGARVVQWASTAPSARRAQTRLSILRTFAIWLHAEDARHEIPDPNAFGRRTRKRPTPYLLTQEQIRQIMDAALLLPPAGSITPHTVRTMIGLGATAGLRRSEVVGLSLTDLTPDGLTIRDSKFGKSRLVALHQSVHEVLDEYISHRVRIGGAYDHLFILASGKPPTANYLTQTFLQLVRSVGLRGGPGEPGPRFHSLRHSFAVRSLVTASHSNRTEVSRHMLALTTYLGHSSVEATYWYLEATPPLLRSIVEAAERTHTRRSDR